METKDGTAKKLCTLPYHIQLNVYTQFQAIQRRHGAAPRCFETE